MHKYPGNQWNKPLEEDELRILYHVLREIAFLWDFIYEYVSMKM